MSTGTTLHEEYSSLVRAIAMATVALRGHLQGTYESAHKRVVQRVVPAEQVASVLHTGRPTSSTLPLDVAVSLVIQPECEAIQGLVLMTRDTSYGAAQNGIIAHLLSSTQTGLELLDETGIATYDQIQERPPERHAIAMHEILRSFHDETIEGFLSMIRFSFFAVAGAYPKIAERLLIIRQLWGPLKHITDILKYVRPSSSFPWKVEIHVIDTAVKLEKCGVPLPPLSPGGSWRYSVSKEDVPKWLSAIVETYEKLEDALLNESKTTCKDSLDRPHALEATMHLIVLHGLLQSRFMDYLCKDRWLNEDLLSHGESPKLHPCVTGRRCEHAVPRKPEPKSQKPGTPTNVYEDNTMWGLSDGEDSDWKLSPQALVVSETAETDSDIPREGEAPATISSKVEEASEGAEAAQEASASHPDGAPEDDLRKKDAPPGSSEADASTSTQPEEQNMVSSESGVVALSPVSEDTASSVGLTATSENAPTPEPSGQTIVNQDDVPTEDTAETTAATATSETAPAPEPTTSEATSGHQTIVTPDDVRTEDESAPEHLRRQLQALVSPISAVRSLLAQLLNSKLPVFPSLYCISVPASNPVLPSSLPLPDAERDAFLDKVVEGIPEVTKAKSGWSRRATARDWLYRRLLDTPVLGVSAAELGYPPVPPKGDGAGVDCVPRVHPEAAMMGLACMFSSGKGCEMPIQTERSDPSVSTAQDDVGRGDSEDAATEQDTRRALERIFSTYELPIGLPDARKCCWCCWRLRRWLNESDVDCNDADPLVRRLWYQRGRRADGSAVAEESAPGPRPGCPTFLLTGSSQIVLPWVPPAEGMGVPVEFLRVLLDDLLKMLRDVAQSQADTEQPDECVIA